MRAERAITLLISLWLMSAAVTAQSPKHCPTPAQYQRVAIEFERFDDARGTVWLRLHNETAWDKRVPVELNFPGGSPTTEVMNPLEVTRTEPRPRCDIICKNMTQGR